MDGNVGQDFAIELIAGLLEAADELRVACAVQLGGGGDAHDPERAKLTLLLAAAGVGELESALDGFLRCLVELGFGKEVTARPIEDLFAAVVTLSAAFDARHGCCSFLRYGSAAGGKGDEPLHSLIKPESLADANAFRNSGGRFLGPDAFQLQP